MATVPTQQVVIPPTSSSSSSSSETPNPSGSLDMHYYTTEGLSGLQPHHYHNPHSFKRTIESQAEKLYQCDWTAGGQYLIFSAVTEDKFTAIDRWRDDNYKGLRFMYLKEATTLIVKITAGSIYGIASSEFTRMLWRKAEEMGLPGALADFRAATFRGIGGDCKEADSALWPFSAPSRRRRRRRRRNDDDDDGTRWPTVVCEIGIEESLHRLRVEAHWWLEFSGGEVGIVLLFSISQDKRRIHIEQWEIIITTGSQDDDDEPGSTIKMTGQVDIIGGGGEVTGAPLTLDFRKVFLRDPVKGEEEEEGDIVLTREDLLHFAAQIWRGAGLPC